MNKNIRAFLKYLYLERRYSANTIKSYGTDLRQFEEFLQTHFGSENVFWDLVDKKIIRYFLVRLQEQQISRRSVARKLATLKSFFRYLLRQGEIKSNPASTLKMPRFEKKLPEYLSLKELENLLEQPDYKSFEGLRDLAIMELFYGTGLRLTELINLKLGQVDFKEKLIRVIGKGNKERIVPFGGSAQLILEKYLLIRAQYAAKSVDNIFVLKSGNKMYPMAVQRIVKKYLSKVSEIQKKSPHVLRHTYATHLLNAGADIRVVKDLLGHENLSTTQVYTHLSIEHLKNIYNQAHPRASNKSSKNRRRS
ncbi:MAG: tyrosine recombinase XerC [Calditrichaeota bacterium]|nr:tyrosine recombinase XerC [Calditrichota bacterium]